MKTWEGISEDNKYIYAITKLVAPRTDEIADAASDKKTTKSKKPQTSVPSLRLAS